MSGRIDLRKLLLGRQEQLATDLAVGRELVGHPTAKGDVAEFDWNGAVDGFLPGRYAVSNAFVIDADGQVSDQIDIVVHDRHFCPLFFEHGGARFIPAESVFAIFEVKQELNKEHVEYAGEKAESVRQLRRTDAPIVQRGEVKGPRGPFDIIAGILTLSSSWHPPFGEPFETALGSLAGRQRLDLGCAISDGGFEVNPESGEVEIGDAEGSLMFFLLRLSLPCDHAPVHALDTEEREKGDLAGARVHRRPLLVPEHVFVRRISVESASDGEAGAESTNPGNGSRLASIRIGW